MSDAMAYDEYLRKWFYAQTIKYRRTTAISVRKVIIELMKFEMK